MTHNALINGGIPIRETDMGRRFFIKLRIFDTVSRPVRFWLNHATSRPEKRLDFDRVYYAYQTRANEWGEYIVPYTAYEAKYGVSEQQKILSVQFTPTGSSEKPIYIGAVSSWEMHTDIGASECRLIGF